MPNLILEYSNNIHGKINFDQLFSRLHQVMSSTAGADIKNCKSRALGYDHYLISTGDEKLAFVNLVIRIFEGRPAEIKQEIAQQCLDALVEFYANTGNENVQISVEVQDIQPQFYFKKFVQD